MKTIEYDLSKPRQALDALADAMKAGDKVTVIPVDHYQEYRLAQVAGEVVQHKNAEGEWVDPPEGSIGYEYWEFNDPPDRYRIKPDTVKMWQWVYRDGSGDIRLSEIFFPDIESARNSYQHGDVTVIQRADWTEIEVEK